MARICTYHFRPRGACGQGGERFGWYVGRYRNWDLKFSSLKYLAGRMSFKNYWPAIKRIMNSLFTLAFPVGREC